MKISKVAVGLTAIAALMLTGCSGNGGGGGADSADKKSYDWDMTVTVGDTSTWYAGAEKFGELLAEKSDGRMTLNVFGNEQLSGGDPAAGVEQLMSGQKAFSYNSPIIYSGIDPRFSAITAPFLFDDYAQADEVIAATGLDAYKELAEEQGVKLLGFGESGFRQITNSKHAITKPEDFKNLKFRVAGSELFIDMYKSLGADPVAMNFAEVFTSLQNGTIDGQENPFDVIYSGGLPEVQDYLSILNYVYDPLLLGMSLDMWNELSEEDQAIVQEAADEANEFQIKMSRDREDEQLVEFKEEMQVDELSPEEIAAFREALQPLYDSWTPKWTETVFDAVNPAN
ncbi:DctP family TRAP transporter solute-binding subunit [Leucobacter sp. UCMA 4100]|uniref:DctP family TRAP transporter solute-binding subunit n=1 Tax=Leucobacter sp. UCMA 4100 TaxID=2810534 RepID=UPI0022EB1592|nr:DctP family TRAP transporter solute-binding subunit [Leucobacter sp. UCMA 4100]MDA3146389.1 DctP family TRAP transporter solute-binding subunit [Leucobacter sp. UCMA 4100]